MTSSSLIAQRKRLEDGSTCSPYQWHGEAIDVRDDANTVLHILDIFADESIAEKDKPPLVVSKLFPQIEDALTACQNKADTFSEFLQDVIWDVCGLNIGGHSDCEPLWDINEDAELIRSSFLQAYGTTWDELRDKISFAEFRALIWGVPKDTPLGRAMYYRNPETRPQSGESNEAYIKEWDRLHDAFALHKTTSSQDSIEAQDSAMSDSFLALKRAATR